MIHPSCVRVVQNPRSVDHCCRSDPLQNLACYIDVICMHSAMLNDDTSSHRCVLMGRVLASDRPLTFRWLARQHVVPIPHYFLPPLPHAITLPQSMHRPVPACNAEGLLPEENPQILVLHGPPLQLPERMGSRSLRPCERTITYTRLRWAP